ncbi:MAG: type II/IV secretion system protein [Candidatus Omnitrophica bacterium]|nr:type II/IV secretion system protein [Candidatus Omnitrophota bacterium]
MESTREKIFKALHKLPNINPSDLDALAYASYDKHTGLTKTLIKQGIISEEALLILLVRELRLPSIDLSKYRLDEHLKNILPEKIARQYSVVPIASLGDTLTVAVSDPLNVFAIDDLRNITGKTIEIVLASHSQILRTIEQFYASAAQSIAKATENMPTQDLAIVQEQFEQMNMDAEAGEQAPIIRMVNLIIKEAIRQRASDIHLEPSPEGMRVRYRIDGILQDILTIPAESQSAVVVRIKIMSRMDITSFQVPQDGRFKMRMSSGEIDFRVSMLPTTHGQKVVMRLLDKANLSVGLNKLGFSKRSVDTLEEVMYKPFGMILVTGPTGSGKSTTLYSMINKLNTIDRNIITIEDPVEYLVDGLTQIETKHEIGFNFAMGLRAILRQSPDIVMVGEIRDAETADISIKASLTGQLVLSTLHTNDAAGAVTRLVDMGLEPFLVASSLLLVCAQRLCRKVCPYCKHPVDIPAKALKKIESKIKKGTVFYEGKGCERCRHTGYLGRLGVTEVLQIDDHVRDLLIGGKSAEEISHYAQEKQGMKLLFDDCVDKMCQGETTLTEVYRISSLEEEQT